jgi:hypothetical protein
MASERRHYHSYLLRLWQAGSGDTPEWRIVLEDVRTRERHTFMSIESVAAFLYAQTGGRAPSDGASDESEVGRAESASADRRSETGETQQCIFRKDGPQ